MRNQLTVSWFFVCKNIKNIPRPDYLKSMLESVIKRNYPMNGFDNIKDAYSYNKNNEDVLHIKRLTII